jgi:ketosteroid isomerase-like protein
LKLLEADASGELGFCVLAYAGDYLQSDGSYVTASGRSVNVLRRQSNGDWKIQVSSLTADPA